MTPEIRKTDGARAKIFRDGPEWDGSQAATIGAFRCDNAETGAALLKDIAADLVKEGFTRILGPMEGDTWHSYRLVIETDESPAFLMEPSSAPQDVEAFRSAGFGSIAEYFSARAPIVEEPAPEMPDGIKLETWDGNDPEAHFTEVHGLSTASFAGNLFYKPLSLDGFLEMYMPFVPMLRKDLIFLARDDDGVLLGYLFGIPDYAQGPDTKTVILKTYASLRPGIGHVMAHRFHETARLAGFETAIHALIQDDNRSAERSRKHGGTIFRRYALMGWRDG